VTISKETTFITEPLRADGYVDYVAAVNQAASEGVTPENNAAVLFCRAFGPSMIGADFRPRFFRMLGIDPLPEEGKYVVTSDEHINRLVEEKKAAEKDLDEERYREKLDEDFQQMLGRPWSEKEFPEWARWLELNEEPLFGTQYVFAIPPGQPLNHYFCVEAVNTLGQPGFRSDIMSPTDRRFRP